MNNKTNELNMYDVASRMGSEAKQYERAKISILADQVKEYIESQAEVGLLSDADLYYIVNSILSETIDQVIEWNGSLDLLKSMLVEPIGCVYKAAIDELTEEFTGDMGI